MTTSPNSTIFIVYNAILHIYTNKYLFVYFSKIKIICLLQIIRISNFGMKIGNIMITKKKVKEIHIKYRIYLKNKKFPT